MADEEKPPGTLSGEDVKDEFRQFKDKLLGVPAAVSHMAKAATEVASEAGSKLKDDFKAAQEKVEAAAVVQDEVVERLDRIESRLESLETAVLQIKNHIVGGG